MRATTLSLSLALSLAAPATALAQETPIWTGTLRGELRATGNTLGLDAADNLTPGTTGGIGTFIANPLDIATRALQDGTFPVGTTNDATKNGSTAELDLPETATVAKAQLVWACSSQVFGVPTTPKDTPTSVTLTLPDGLQQTIVPQGSVTDLSLVGATYRYYQRWADVTSAVQTGGAGSYMVSNVTGTEQWNASAITACGWTLFVVFTEPSLPVRNINLWMLGEEVRFTGTGCCETTIDVSGFCTPVAEGTALGRLHVAALEGDARFVDDALTIYDPLFDDGSYYPLSGPNNAANNFFASQINGDDGALDTRGTFGTMNHAVDPTDGTFTLSAGARQGWDVTTIPLNDEDYNPYVLENGQSETSFVITTQGDDFIVSAMGLELDFAAPDLKATHSVGHDVTFAGDTLHYTVALTNDGTERADTVYFCYAAPENATMVAGSFKLEGTADAAVTTATLAPAGCAAGNGGVMIGAFDPGQSKTITLDFTVDRILAAPDPLSYVTSTPTWHVEWAPPCTNAVMQTDRQVGPVVALPAYRLELVLTANPATPPAVTAGDIVTYTLTISNTGSGPTPAEVVARLPVPNGMAYVAGSTTLNGQSVPDAGGASAFATAQSVSSPGEPTGVIAAGEAAVIVIQVTITETGTTAIVEKGFADGDGEGPVAEVQSNTVTTLVTGGAIVESDIDEDGILDGNDNCVTTYNPQQENNYDATGYNPNATDEGDACDDSDGDGLLDVEEDVDHDGPDATETDATLVDTDGDGLCDGNTQVSPCIGVEDKDGDGNHDDWGVSEPSPIDPDSDDDGICDGAFAGGNCKGGEVTQGTDALDTDSDDDGLCDGPGGGGWDQSGCLGSESGDDGVFQPNVETDPADPDTDGDGLCDGFVNGATTCRGGEDKDGDRDPTDFDEPADNETNPLDRDTDHGGVDDGTEDINQTNPRDPCDGDGQECEVALIAEGGACSGGSADLGVGLGLVCAALFVAMRRRRALA